MKKILVVLTLGMLGGCANRYPIALDSNPQGAAVICDGKVLGYTPYIEYASPDKVKNGINTNDCVAQWASGVSVRYRATTASDIAKHSTGVRQTVQRGYEGDYSMDAKAAMDRNYQQQQLQQQRSIANQQDDYVYKPQNTYCNKIGNQVLCNSF